MDMWSVRNQALADLTSNLQQESEVPEEAFGILEKCIERLFSNTTSEHEKFAIICCHTVKRRADFLMIGWQIKMIASKIAEATKRLLSSKQGKKHFRDMAYPRGVEPPTYRSAICRSIH